MTIQQIYWQSVWNDTIKKSQDKNDQYFSHSKEEELTYLKLLKRQNKKTRSRS